MKMRSWSAAASFPGSSKVERRFVIAYTGDTEWTDELLDAASAADLLIAEAYTFERPIGDERATAKILDAALVGRFIDPVARDHRTVARQAVERRIFAFGFRRFDHHPLEIPDRRAGQIVGANLRQIMRRRQPAPQALIQPEAICSGRFVVARRGNLDAERRERIGLARLILAATLGVGAGLGAGGVAVSGVKTLQFLLFAAQAFG